ncbi:hypothetical protein GCM10027035_46240 [Emticicia sediminis]
MLKVFSTFILLFVTSFAFSQESKVPLCGTPDSQILDAKVLERMQNAGKNPNLRMADLPMLECLVAVAVEYDIYLNYNKNQDLIKGKVYEYFEKVSKVYEDEMKIKLTVNHIEIITTNRSDTLQRGKKKLGYHIAHLFRLGSAALNWKGVAFIKKNITTGEYDLYCISGLFNYEKEVLKTIAHEIGHCFDSPHTHDCNWPNGPLDFCSTPEGECMKNAYLNSIGTIMSYCSQSIGFTFHPFCRAVIRSRAEEILLPIRNVPAKPDLRLFDRFNTTEPFLSWSNNLITFDYRFQISDNPDFTKIIIDSTVKYNYFQAYSLEKDKPYYCRIKASNNLGESSWSEINKFTCNGVETQTIPAVKGVFLDKNNIENARLEVFPVIGASYYEFRITDMDRFYSEGFAQTPTNIFYNIKTNSPILNFNDLQKPSFLNVTLYWQVRVFKNGTEGDWGQVKSFDALQAIRHIYPKSTDRINTIFPIIWDLGYPKRTNNVNREYILQISADESFAKIIYEKKRLMNVAGTDGNNVNIGYEIIDNLESNTEYFYRYREKAGTDIWQSSKFKTGVKNLKWKFFHPTNQPFLESTVSFTQNYDSSKVFFINDTGIYKTDGINWDVPLNPKTTNGLVKYSIFSSPIKNDLNDNLYFNQSLYELVKFDGKKTTSLSSLIPFPGKDCYDFFIDRKGDIFGLIPHTEFSNTNILKFAEGKWQKLPPLPSYPKILFDNNNTPIAQIDNEFYYKFDGIKWELLNPHQARGSYGSFTIDSKNNIWWADLYNVYKLDSEKKITTYTGGIDFPYGRYRSLIVDKKGVVWILSQINNKVVLLKFKNDKWTINDEENEPPLPLTFISDYSGMAVDKQNRIWIFTNSYGIFIYDDSGQVKSQTINAEKILNQRNTTKPFKIIANASSNLPLSYKIVSGPAKIKKDSITLTGEVGKVTLQISQPGNEIYEPAKNVELLFEVTAKATQTISFAKIEQKTLAERAFTLSATTTSGLPITYQIISGPATVNGNVVTLTGTGRVIIKAIQNGNAEFLAANELMQEFCVIPAKPIISADASNNWILEVNADKNLQWYFNGTKVENGTKSTLLATQNGQYKVEVFNSDATCASNTSDTFQLLILANEDDKSQTIKVFPNPADDWVTVDSENSLKINSVKLYDLKGSLLYTNEKSELPHKIKIHSSWQSNVLLEIKTNDKTYLKKLVLN